MAAAAAPGPAAAAAAAAPGPAAAAAAAAPGPAAAAAAAAPGPAVQAINVAQWTGPPPPAPAGGPPAAAAAVLVKAPPLFKAPPAGFGHNPVVAAHERVAAAMEEVRQALEMEQQAQLAQAAYNRGQAADPGQGQAQAQAMAPGQAQAQAMAPGQAQAMAHGPGYVVVPPGNRALADASDWPTKYRQLFIGNLPAYVGPEDVEAIFRLMDMELVHCHVFEVAPSGLRSAKVVVPNPAINMPMAIKELHGHLPCTQHVICVFVWYVCGMCVYGCAHALGCSCVWVCGYAVSVCVWRSCVWMQVMAGVCVLCVWV